jgi:hypothetical protein
MVKARAELVIDRPADVVWARIRDFVDVSWIPNTETSRLEGDKRIVRMRGRPSDVVQRLLNHDDKNRTFSYCLASDVEIAPGKKISKLEATVAVNPKGESSSWLTYDVDTDDFLVAAVNAEYQASLNNLKTLLGTQDMPKARAEIVIDRPADVVWARIRDFWDVSWVPRTESCERDGDDVRSIKMVGHDFRVVERLLSQDDTKRTQSYDLAKATDLEALFGPGWKETHLLASLTVTPKGSSSSWVTWDIQDASDRLLAGTHAEYQGALDHLKALLER